MYFQRKLFQYIFVRKSYYYLIIQNLVPILSGIKFLVFSTFDNNLSKSDKSKFESNSFNKETA